MFLFLPDHSAWGGGKPLASPGLSGGGTHTCLHVEAWVSKQIEECVCISGGNDI